MTDATPTDITLGQAVVDLRRAEDPDDAITDGMSKTSANAFNMHDAVHLIFDCDTSLKGEIAAHAWMALGTTAPIAEMHRAVANQEHRDALAGIGHLKLIGTWFLMLPELGGILWRALRMRRKIAYQHLNELMGQTIADIRTSHGIRV